MSTVQIVPGFSLVNRWLLYTSVMLAPAQLISGIGSNCPTNIGFLAYNWYTQIQWYQAIQAHQLHALSLLPIHFNLIYSFTYIGGVTSGNVAFAVLLSLGTAGVMVLNTVAAWTSWATNLPEGFGVYQFFFFGWRTLNSDWYKLFLVWQIFDSITAVSSVCGAIAVALQSATVEKELPMYYRYLCIPLGAVCVLLGSWPLIMWTELIVARNNIESDTDMVAVWLFVAQVVAMLIPSLGCCKGECED
jgi:hypothetical protein